MKLFITIILILFISTGNIYALELSLNSADTSPYSTLEDNGFYDILLKEVFENLGIDIEINHLLSKRSIQNADNGIDDGEFARIEGADVEYKNLKIVPEPLVDFYFVAYSKNSKIVISNWDSLNNHSIAFINGWVYLQNNVPDSVSVTLVSNEDSLFKMLLKDRVEIILYSKLRGLSKIERDGLEDVFLLDQPLASRGMYLYLNKKYEYLVPDITTELVNIKENGRYMEIMEEYLVFQ